MSDLVCEQIEFKYPIKLNQNEIGNINDNAILLHIGKEKNVKSLLDE